MAKKKAEPKPRPETYEKSELKIHGSFDDVIKAAFAKDKKPKANGGTGTSGGG